MGGVTTQPVEMSARRRREVGKVIFIFKSALPGRQCGSPGEILNTAS
jgi:hypothetical protein